jgi:phosphosulfolactate synthase
MRNFELQQLPFRADKPRVAGLTMVMDKGLSLRQVEDFLEVSAEFTDMIKLGFGTAYLTPKLEEKLELYQSAHIPVFFGGTLFEAFLVRNQMDDFKRMLDYYKLRYVEISDGSLNIPHEEKCALIADFAKDFVVISEVGSKDADKIIPPYQWIDQMECELQAGSWKIIGEARESGTVGIFRNSGEVRSGLIAEIIRKIPIENVIWEAPQKSQQVWFIELYGSNVNLGNIAPNEVIPLETLRLGLRGDSFHFFL